MWSLMVWRSRLPLSDCEQRLEKIPRRTWLISNGPSTLIATGVGRSFRLQTTATATRALFAPYFHGSLVDKHGATDIRGRLFPAPLVQTAILLGALGIMLSSVGIVMGVPVSSRVLFVPMFSLALSFVIAVAVRLEPAKARRVLPDQSRQHSKQIAWRPTEANRRDCY